MVDSNYQTLTVGEKLLKEPIWIGMIVILNLVLFFCISYVIRRKCGQRISEMIPQRKKSSIVVSPSDSKVESSPSLNRSVLYMSTETPILSPITKPRLILTTIPKGKPETCSSNGSIPSTPVIDEYNREAALKLFAAYNAELKHIEPSFSQLSVDKQTSDSKEDFITCGFQGGTVSFSDDEEPQKSIINDGKKTKENAFGRCRSSDISTSTVGDRCVRIKRVLPYPDHASPKPDRHQPTSDNINEHCYPEIRIVNEFNEECVNTDSDQSEVNSPRLVHSVSQTKSLCNEDIATSPNLHNGDSGYPSTSTVSSNNTQSAGQESLGIKHVYHTASDRRKMYGSKSKSASFYKLSAQTVDAEDEEIEVPSLSRNECVNEKKRSMVTTKAFRSFDAGQVCRSCSDKMMPSMNSFSCENDLDKIRRYDSVSSHCCSTRHECGRRRHQRRHKCCCRHKRSYCDGEHDRCSSSHSRGHQPRYFSRYTSPTSRYLSLSEIRDIRRNHKKALARLSSTESEGFNNDTDSWNQRRAHYRSKEHFSDGCMPNQRHLSSSERSLNWTYMKDSHFKSQMMQSFLYDAYNSNARYGDSLDLDEAHLGNQLMLPQCSVNSLYSVFKTSEDSSKSISPTREAFSSNKDSAEHSKRYPSPAEKTSNDTTNTYNSPRQASPIARNAPKPVTVVTDNSDTRCASSPRSEGRLDSESDGVVGGDRDDGGFKKVVHKSDSSGPVYDSAYQTKQSSMDIYREQTMIPIIETELDMNKRNDSVRRHLHQAALKLVILKRRQNQKSESNDSAIQMLSKDDMSPEEDSRRTFGKRTSAIQVIQMKDLQLSQVMEEHSGISSYNTPNNETQTEAGDKNSTDRFAEDAVINHINDVMITDSMAFQETIV